METTMSAEKGQPSRKKKIIRVIAIFFAVMLMLTYVSRAASDALKAKVTTESISTNTLDEGKQGTGKWVSGNTQYFTTYYGRRTTNVFVLPGQAVKVGDPLFAYDVGTVTGGKPVTVRKVEAAKKALETAKELLAQDPESLVLKSRVTCAELAVLFVEFMYAQTYAIQNGGVVLSTFNGTILSTDLVQGKPSTSGSTGFEVALGSPVFSFEVATEEAKSFAVGDQIELLQDNESSDDRVTIKSISPPSKEGKITILCEDTQEKQRTIGVEQQWQIKRQSKPYNVTVSVESLRISGEGKYFVLVAEEKQTILGSQLCASKVDVKVLSHDSKRAAVEGILTGEMKIIKTSSKEIKNGDLVLINEE